MSDIDTGIPTPSRVTSRQGFARELTTLRQRAGLTIRQVANKVGVRGAHSTVGDWFTGQSLPSTSSRALLVQVLEACGVSDAESREQWLQAWQRVRRAPGPRPAGLEPYRGLAPFRLEDAQSLSFPDESFDKVLLTEVIEHLPQPDRAILEVARVLRPRGLLVVSTPSRFSPMNLAYDLKRRVRRYAFNEHLHELTPGSFRRLVGRHLRVERLEYANFVLPYPADELYLRLGSPAIALLKIAENRLARTPGLRRLGWTMVLRARKA